MFPLFDFLPHFKILWGNLFGKKFFWLPRWKMIFHFSHEAFKKVDQFWGLNEINSLEKANYPLSVDAKQNSERLIVLELWLFESFFIFPPFSHFPRRSVFFIDPFFGLSEEWVSCYLWYMRSIRRCPDGYGLFIWSPYLSSVFLWSAYLMYRKKWVTLF